LSSKIGRFGPFHPGTISLSNWEKFQNRSTGTILWNDTQEMPMAQAVPLERRAQKTLFIGVYLGPFRSGAVAIGAGRGVARMGKYNEEENRT
jgi:hypothetical protein